MKYVRKILPVILVLFGLAGLSLSAALAQGLQLQAVPTPLEKAVAGLGGIEALQNLGGFTVAASGVRWLPDEGLTPGGPADRIGPFEVQVIYDITADALRLDYNLESRGQPREVHEIITGQVGYIEGVDNNGGQPGIKNMSSDRWASIRKHQRLLNPHLILRDILANSNQTNEGGEVLFEGSVHHLLVVEDEVAPLTLYINAGTGRIAKLTTMESDSLRRDVPLEVFYYNWQPIGEEGFFFPAEVYVAYDGDIVHKEIRTAIEVNPTIDSALFEFPAEATPVFDATLATRGEAFHQYHQNHAAFGFPRDVPQTEVIDTELGPGIFHLTGSQHHSLVIEQAEGIVVLEAPFDEIRSQAVINWIKATFPNKPISHVVSSHHHVDHAAGLRTYVAEGATIVMGEAAKSFFEENFLASSTIVPDALSNNPVATKIETVAADGSFTIPDETQPVEVYPIENPHAEDMVITYVPEAGLVFVSDLYSPNPNATANPGAGAALLKERITELGLNVTMIVGAHGGTITLEEFEALLKL